MESFTESLNRLKEVHENEVMGEYLGEDKLSARQQSKGQGQDRGLPHVCLKFSPKPGPRLPGPERES